MDVKTILLIVLVVSAGVNTFLTFQWIRSRRKIREMAESVARSARMGDTKDDVIAIVSHDLKGPLNRIYALINLMELSQDKVTEEQTEYMNKMSQVVKEGLALIKNTLDIRKIEKGDTPVDLQSMDLSQMLTNLVSDYQQLAQYKAVSFKLEADEHAPVITDPIYLERVLENLLSNALKFSPPAETVQVVLKPIPEHFLIMIQDNGMGISEDELPYIYNKYKSLSPQPTAGESSAGIGLAIVKSLCELMNYEISFESETGKGTKAILKVPNHGSR